MDRTVRRGLILAIGVAFSLAWAVGPASACEAIQKILLFSSPVGPTPCPVQCPPDGPPDADPQSQKLCWGAQCRSFNGDNGQFGQLKKDVPGNLEALVFDVTNVDTNEHFTIVQSVPDPVCAANIPAQTAGLTCDGLFKIKGLRPIGERTGRLCTFAKLDILDKLIHTPQSQNFTVTDLNGRLCGGQTRVGDQWWLFYQVCCSPQVFGLGGEGIVTETTLIINQGGNCIEDKVRPGTNLPQPIPQSVTGPCM